MLEVDNVCIEAVGSHAMADNDVVHVRFGGPYQACELRVQIPDITMTGTSESKSARRDFRPFLRCG